MIVLDRKLPAQPFMIMAYSGAVKNDRNPEPNLLSSKKTDERAGERQWIGK
jgi:hypothetical protein